MNSFGNNYMSTAWSTYSLSTCYSPMTKENTNNQYVRYALLSLAARIYLPGLWYKHSDCVCITRIFTSRQFKIGKIPKNMKSKVKIALTLHSQGLTVRSREVVQTWGMHMRKRYIMQAFCVYSCLPP